MRILFTMHEPLDGNTGGPGVVLRLAEQFQRMGHRVTTLSTDDMPASVPPKLAGAAFPWFASRHIGKMVHELDVVDASSGDTWPWLEYRARRHQRAERSPLFVTHSHGLEHSAHLRRMEDARRGNLKLSWKYPLYRGGFRLWEVARSFQRADLALFLNQHDLRYAVAELNVRPERARLVANGLSGAFLGLPLLETPSGADQSIGIAQIGTYYELKGIQYGAAAANRVLKKHQNVHAGFFGTRHSREVVLKDFDPDVWDRIRVVPSYEHADLPRLLHGYQIKLFPTLGEGFGNAVIEAMSCGLAPVTTDVPGPTEIVAPGVDGLVIPPRSSEAIEDALRLLLENRALLDRLRRSAHRKAQRYSWTRIAAKRLALYEEFLARKREAAADRVTTSAGPRGVGGRSLLQRVRWRGKA